MFLSDQQLKELTKRTAARAQARQLNFMGIPFGERLDGSIVVAISAVDIRLGLVVANKITGEDLPDWEAIINAKT